MRVLYYVMSKKGVVRPEPDLGKWAKWMGTENRQIERTVLKGVLISTVFLGIDHTFWPAKNTKPVLFETMIFGGSQDGNQWRYTSIKEAKKGHKLAVKIAKESS